MAQAYAPARDMAACAALGVFDAAWRPKADAVVR
jgi:hypothetical protein